MAEINNLPHASLYSRTELFLRTSRQENWKRLLFNVAVFCINFMRYQKFIKKIYQTKVNFLARYQNLTVAIALVFRVTPNFHQTTKPQLGPEVVKRDK